MAVSSKSKEELIEENEALRSRLEDLQHSQAVHEKAEKALRESEARFRTVIESLPFDFFLIDKSGRYAMLNEACKRHWGDVVGKRPEDICPDQDTLALWQSNNHRAFCGEVVEDEVALPPEGKEGYYRNIISPIRDGDQIRGILGVNIDITEYKETESALREATQLVETVFDATHVLIAYMDPQFKFIKVNKAYALADEKEQSFFPGKNHFDLYPNAENEAIFRRVVGTGKPYFAEAKLFEYAEHPERGVSYWDWSLIPIKDPNNRVSGLVLSLANVTERKRAEDALRESEGKLNAMLQSVADHMSMMDEDLTIIWANETAKNIFGNDIVGRKCYEAYHGRDKPCEPYPCLSLRALQDGNIHEHDTQVVGKDGKTKHFHCSANVALRNSEGKPAAVLEISRDITDQKCVEQALRESERSYRAVVENAAEGIVVVQGQTLQFVNSRLVSMIGYSEKELMSRPFIEFIHPDHREWAMGIHIKRLKGEEVPPIYELKIVDKQGNTKWLENNGLLIEWRNKPATLNFLRDVTERKKAEQAVWASESEKKSILNAISDHILFHDTNLVIRWGNEAAAISIGMTQEELVGCHCYELWQGRSEPCERCPVLRAIETGSHAEGIMTTPDGKWWEIIGEPVRDRDGQIRGAIEIGRDITERKKAENALQESEQRFKVLFESAPDAIYLNDLKGNIVDGNRAAEEMTGYKRERLIGKNLAESGLLLPEQVPKVIARLEKNAMGEPIEPEEFTLKRKDGSYVTVEVRTFPVRIRNRTLSLGIARDISARKKARETIREERDRAQKYLDVAGVLLVAIDVEGRVSLINKKGCEILRYEEEDVIGKDWFDNFLPERVRKEVSTVFEKIVAGEFKPVEYFENPILTKDGDERMIAWHNTILRTEQGDIIGILSSGEDITERKRAEEALRSERDKLQTLMGGLALTGIGIDVVSIDYRVLFQNQTLIERFGDLTGRLCYEEYIGLKKPCDFCPMTKAIRSKEMESVELTAINGRSYELISAPLANPDGTVDKVIEVVKDITERKQAEVTLQESELKFKTIFENAGGAIFIADTETGIILECNSQAERMLGRPRAEIIGMHQSELHPEGEPEEYKEKFAAHVQKGRVVDFEGEVQHAGGGKTPVWISAQCLKIGGKDVILGLFIDTSELAKAEKKVLEYQLQLKSLASQLSLTEERERRQIATELHDRIGQSLVISKIKLDELRESAASGERTEALKEVCNCLAQVIQDTRVLTFDLSSPILYELGFEAAVAEWLAEQIREKHGIETKFEDDGKPKPLGDDIRVILFRNVRELLINVVKHANARNAKVSIHKVGDKIRITVEDDGVGFDPAEATSMAAERATFGLFSIRERLEHLEGHLKIKSKPGRGSKITMTAPLKH